jgi:hypothetical protein
MFGFGGLIFCRLMLLRVPRLRSGVYRRGRV